MIQSQLLQLLQFYPLFSVQISFQPLPSLVATFTTNSYTVNDDMRVAGYLFTYLFSFI